MPLKNLAAAGAAFLVALTSAALAGQSLSDQVLQLLLRDNTWVGRQSFEDLRVPLAAVPGDTVARLYTDPAGNLYFNGGLVAGAGGGVTPHTLLSTTHADTLAVGAARGAVIVGNATPVWSRLTIGAAGTVLSSDGTDVSWAAAGGTPTTRTITAGAGLTGGGSLAADRTLDVGVGAGLTVAADAVSLTVPVTVASGGTGATTLTGLLLGTGTTAVSTVTNSSTVGQVLRVTGAAAYGFGAVDLADTDAITGNLPTGRLNSGTAASATTFWRGDGTWATPAGGAAGTVTSVALTVPTIFSVAGSPITTSGTLALTLANQAANLVWAGPASGAAAGPTFRSLVAADLPTSGVLAGTYTKVTTTTSGIVTAGLTDIDLTTDVGTTVLPLVNGGGLTAAANDTIGVGNGAAWVATTLPACVGGALGYNAATNLFSCTASVKTLTFRQTWPGGRCQNVTASSDWSLPAAGPAVAACVTGANTQFGTLDFADASSLSAQQHWTLPSDWSGTIDVQLLWFTTSITGQVFWQVQTACTATTETVDPAWNTASISASTAPGTTLRLQAATLSAITTTGCDAGEELWIKVLRDPAHASDTLGATARLVAAELTYTRAQ